MADFYVWTEKELGLGVQEMDKEHQELIAKMNVLYKLVENKASVEDLQKSIDDLAGFTVKHFADEEGYMEKIKFPGVATHKVIHQQLLKQFGDYVAEFKKTAVVSPQFFNFLKVWLTSHIRGIDMKYSDFGKNKKAS